MTTRLRIIVTGLIAQHPGLGGVAWDYVQYPVGLSRLGHDVFYFEDSGQWPYRQDGGASGDDWVAPDCKANVEYLNETLEKFGLADKWAYRFATSGEWYGLSDQLRREVIDSADLIIDVSGTLEWPENYDRAGRLVYIDSDPVFTQLRVVADPAQLGLSAHDEEEERKFQRRVAAHDVHFTFGEAMSDEVPSTPYEWQPTRQPILLAEWHPDRGDNGLFTTVMSWTSYKPFNVQGRTYGQKDVEFRKFLGLPESISSEFAIAMNSTVHANWETLTPEDSAPVKDSSHVTTPAEILKQAGWQVVDARTACDGLDNYRSFIEGSRGEWSVAKHGYVVGRSGWFSCRSACYLAAGKPVVVEDTGFAKILPVGEGVLTFTNLDEAVSAINEVEGNYRRHAKAARALAEEFFDSRKVLTDLIERAGSEPRVSSPKSE